MRPISVLTFTAVLGAVALLPACSAGGGSPAQSSLVPAAPGSGPTGPRPTHRITHAVAQPYVYVADLSYNSIAGVIDVLHTGNYDELGWFDAGLDTPVDLFLDRYGNLYAANQFGPSVTEYAPGNWSEPSFTYSSGMKYPTAVTVDFHGNVYENDSSSINQYYQGRNHPVAHCGTPQGGYFQGIAVDNHGDVFTAVLAPYVYTETLYEYEGGLNGCNATALSVPVSEVAALALDKNSNLILANNGNVEVVDAPGYSEVNETIGSGFACAQNVHLNKANRLAFVTDVCNRTVTVVNYQTGENEVVLGNYFGLQTPASAVEQPNAVY